MPRVSIGVRALEVTPSGHSPTNGHTPSSVVQVVRWEHSNQEHPADRGKLISVERHRMSRQLRKKDTRAFMLVNTISKL